jgi:hypothetical protein
LTLAYNQFYNSFIKIYSNNFSRNLLIDNFIKWNLLFYRRLFLFFRAINNNNWILIQLFPIYPCRVDLVLLGHSHGSLAPLLPNRRSPPLVADNAPAPLYCAPALASSVLHSLAPFLNRRELALLNLKGKKSK